MAKTDQELLESYKARIKRQNNRIKKNYDKVTAALPKGTVDRIRALGLTVNGAINESLIAFLECLEEQDKTESSQTIHNVHASSKTEKPEKHTPTPTKAEIGANTTPYQGGKAEESGSNENNPVKAGFDGLKACEWNTEDHSGVVPHPPMGTPNNAIWDSSMGEWYEPLPF
ncbi:hypothetical protein C810_01352 [Lachnospiraceae bacterium A2]|nr:hypothetical protein C810_01352 [Lachnospiraceae bacterium A2]